MNDLSTGCGLINEGSENDENILEDFEISVKVLGYFREFRNIPEGFETFSWISKYPCRLLDMSDGFEISLKALKYIENFKVFEVNLKVLKHLRGFRNIPEGF